MSHLRVDLGALRCSIRILASMRSVNEENGIDGVNAYHYMHSFAVVADTAHPLPSSLKKFKFEPITKILSQLRHSQTMKLDYTAEIAPFSITGGSRSKIRILYPRTSSEQEIESQSDSDRPLKKIQRPKSTGLRRYRKVRMLHFIFYEAIFIFHLKLGLVHRDLSGAPLAHPARFKEQMGY